MVDDRSNERPTPAGAHRLFASPNAVLPADPCTISMHARRILAADVDGLAKAFPAGPIASSRGSVIVTPMPFRTARREICLFVRKVTLSLLTADCRPPW